MHEGDAYGKMILFERNNEQQREIKRLKAELEAQKGANMNNQPKMEINGIELPDVEIVAEQVHYLWMAQKIQSGVTSRLLESTGEELMVPYRQLSETAKELDRQTVKAVYTAVIMAARTQGGKE